MRFLIWLLRLTLFLVLLGFAVKNSEPVTVYYFFGAEWHASLVFVMLDCVCAGAALGILAVLGQIFRQRREIAELKRELRGSQTGARVVPALPLVDQIS